MAKEDSKEECTLTAGEAQRRNDNRSCLFSVLHHAQIEFCFCVYSSQSQKGTPLFTLMKDPYILIAAGKKIIVNDAHGR